MIGSRYVAGGGVEGWPLKRQLMSKCINFYTRSLLGLRSKDCSGAYRCYRVSRLKQLDFSRLRARGYAFQQEMLWQLKRIGCRFDETPIVFADRAYGQSKINSKEAVAALWHIAALGWKNWTDGK
jgi:dolichol-phosphate mannosyltransferase